VREVLRFVEMEQAIERCLRAFRRNARRVAIARRLSAVLHHALRLAHRGLDPVTSQTINVFDCKLRDLQHVTRRGHPALQDRCSANYIFLLKHSFVPCHRKGGNLRRPRDSWCCVTAGYFNGS